MTTPREDCLDNARQLIVTDRAAEYGDLETTAGIVADLLNALPLTNTTADYPLTQMLVKIARLSQNPRHADSWTDIAGYAAIGFELTRPDPPKPAHTVGILDCLTTDDGNPISPSPVFGLGLRATNAEGAAQ